MNNLEKAKEIIGEFYKEASLGIFNTKNVVGDYMTNIYNNGDVSIYICYNYEYFEVFGLNNEEFDKLEEYYDSLVEVIE